jgi:sucrose synthase
MRSMHFFSLLPYNVKFLLTEGASVLLPRTLGNLPYPSLVRRSGSKKNPDTTSFGLLRYTWKLYSERLMTLTGVYGFWKYVSNLERRETRRYIEMFYALKYRSLVSRLMPASASASACQRGSRVRSHSSSLKRVNELLTHLFLESRQARFRCPSISTGKEEEEEAQAGEPSPAFRSVSPQFALLVVYWSYVYLVSKNFGSFSFFFLV